jgi:hypothetical protein
MHVSISIGSRAASGFGVTAATVLVLSRGRRAGRPLDSQVKFLDLDFLQYALNAVVV